MVKLTTSSKTHLTAILTFYCACFRYMTIKQALADDASIHLYSAVKDKFVTGLNPDEDRPDIKAYEDDETQFRGYHTNAKDSEKHVAILTGVQVNALPQYMCNQTLSDETIFILPETIPVRAHLHEALSWVRATLLTPASLRNGGQLTNNDRRRAWSSLRWHGVAAIKPTELGERSEPPFRYPSLPRPSQDVWTRAISRNFRSAPVSTSQHQSAPPPPTRGDGHPRLAFPSRWIFACSPRRSKNYADDPPLFFVFVFCTNQDKWFKKLAGDNPSQRACEDNAQDKDAIQQKLDDNFDDAWRFIAFAFFIAIIPATATLLYVILCVCPFLLVTTGFAPSRSQNERSLMCQRGCFACRRQPLRL